ncbi:alpha/beta hydrolase [Corynebacterium falsenii]|uniref:alpha/beta hydrolase n=1 Tax=Corynebacterium falsenii TaxID=108486 RepID=UPI00234D23BE|nr:alpha/beta hydrolase-fold protein [Corynebacterium falsenii]MDC7103329.1 alpha/beta hydrolase-fold protein [Corynebacterium falsenii]
MLDHIRGYSLISPAVAALAWALLAICLLIIVIALPRHHRVKALVIAVIAGVVLGVGSYVEILLGFGVPSDQLSVGAVASATLAILALFLSIWTIASTWKKSWTLIPALLTVLSSLLVTNQFYALFPDVNSLDMETPYKEEKVSALQSAPSVPLAEWKPKILQPIAAEGTVVTGTPPTPKSKFHPRESYVYLPPAWFTNPRPQLPVLVLMHGIPGTTDQWFSQGEVGLAAHNYQRNHGGVSPIVVTADATDGVFDNPVCTNSAKGNIQTFLSEDLPQWISEEFSATPDRQHWTIGGLSYGGTCALQTIVNNPNSYGNFLDFSGEITPNDGDSHASTVRDFFNNSEQNFREHNPEDLLKTRRYPGHRGLFVAGVEDSTAQKDLRTLNKLAREAGMETSFETVPGGHNFITWRAAMKKFFPVVGEWSGITPQVLPGHPLPRQS